MSFQADLDNIEEKTGKTPSPKLPGLLLGIGLGGFVDGIVLHQILQWHHMLTDEGSFPRTRWPAWRATPWLTGSSMQRHG